MRSRLLPAFAKNAVWICSPAVLEQLLLLSDTAGTYIFGASIGGVAEGLDLRIFGRPLFVSDCLSDLGTEGDLILVDFSQYGLGLRNPIALEKSEHFYFASDQTVFRALVRLAGVPLIDKAITPVNGGETLSWATILS
jgi:HK97 family phage major capsid protein